MRAQHLGFSRAGKCFVAQAESDRKLGKIRASVVLESDSGADRQCSIYPSRPGHQHPSNGSTNENGTTHETLGHVSWEGGRGINSPHPSADDQTLVKAGVCFCR